MTVKTCEQCGREFPAQLVSGRSMVALSREFRAYLARLEEERRRVQSPDSHHWQ